MERKVSLTNEKVKMRFENQFDLVNYAIKIAKDMILAGRSPRVRSQTENTALIVLEEIVAGKDVWENQETDDEDQFTEEEILNFYADAIKRDEAQEKILAE